MASCTCPDGPGALEPAHLARVWPALIARETARGLAAQGLAAALAGETGPGAAVLARVYRERPWSALELMLHVLAAAGRLPALALLTRAAREGAALDGPVYVAGTRADGTYVVVEGQARGAVRAWGPGESFGAGGAFGQPLRDETVAGEGLRYVFVPDEAVRQAALTYPDAAMALLKARWQPEGGSV